MDRGFELMIPRAKQEEEPKDKFKYEIKFTLFKREFRLCLNVKHTTE